VRGADTVDDGRCGDGGEITLAQAHREVATAALRVEGNGGGAIWVVRFDF
jgi:hypothetical protein